MPRFREKCAHYSCNAISLSGGPAPASRIISYMRKKNDAKRALEESTRAQNDTTKRSAHCVNNHFLPSIASGSENFKISSSDVNDGFSFKNGLRWVIPYARTFKTHVKRRWVGRQVLHVLTSEFSAFPASYYREAVLEGRIRIEGQRVTPEDVLCDGHVLTHSTTIFEPPVAALPIVVLYASRESTANKSVLDFFILSKPCGIPVHPGAAYRKNSLLKIVKSRRGVHFSDCSKVTTLPAASQRLHDVADNAANDRETVSAGRRPHCVFDSSCSAEKFLPQEALVAVLKRLALAHKPQIQFNDDGSADCSCLERLRELDLTTLRPLHRLDRLTSGVVIMSGCSQRAVSFDAALRENRVSKLYLARVIGNFSKICSSPLLSATTALSRAFPHLLVAGHVYCVNSKKGEYRFTALDAGHSRKHEATTPALNVSKSPPICCLAGGDSSARCPDAVTLQKFSGENPTSGKYAETSFYHILYDAHLDESLVLCSPVTGRTHQLR